MRCPCGNHAHGDQNPRRNPRYGRCIVYGYALGCTLYTERGKVIDAFGVYCKLNGYTAKEALSTLPRYK